MEAGTQKNIVGKMTVMVAQVAMGSAQILAKLQSADKLYAAVTSARTALKTALAAWTAALPDLRTFIRQYTTALKAQFGDGNPILSEFGINPRKPPKARTSAEKVVSAAIGKQTRKAKGTLGKKQKEAVTAQGKPGLVMVSPTGVPIPGVVPGPTPPGQSAPVDVAQQLASAGSAASGPAAPPDGSNPPQGSGSSSGK
ncbi:MAG: hypothetical protein ACYDCL_14745 [Myxococcales bacterium]